MDYKNPFNYEGKVVIVTGGAQNIGKEISSAFAACGASVAILDINEELAKEIAFSLPAGGGTHNGFFCDVSQPESIRTAVDAVVGRYGKIDFLVNNAGISVPKLIQEITMEEWDKVNAVNLRGNFCMAKTVGDYMIKQGGGKIVNTASTSSIINSPSLVAYAATKAAIAHMTRTFALEWAKYNINVNAFSPGFIVTSLTENMLDDEKMLAFHTARIPMGRLGRVADMPGTVLFLCSPLASYITGRNIVIDGGRTLY